ASSTTRTAGVCWPRTSGWRTWSTWRPASSPRPPHVFRSRTSARFADRPPRLVGLGGQQRAPEAVEQLREVRAVGGRPVLQRDRVVVQRDRPHLRQHALAGGGDGEAGDAPIVGIHAARDEPLLFERSDLPARVRLVDLQAPRHVGDRNRPVALDQPQRAEVRLRYAEPECELEPLALPRAAGARDHERGELVDPLEIGIGRSPRAHSASMSVSSRWVVSTHSSTMSKMTSRTGRTEFMLPTICPTGKPVSCLFWARLTRRAASAKTIPWSGIGS